MVSHRYFFAFTGLLLISGSVYAATTVAENYLGMLIEKDEYVRLRDCNKQTEYTLAPSGKYGYDAIAELISLRKSTAASIPISVVLNGSIEENINNNKNRYFLVNDISSVKTGESCYFEPTESITAPQAVDASKESLSEKISEENQIATSKSALETQAVSPEESQIRNGNVAVSFNPQQAAEIPLNEAEKARRQPDIQIRSEEKVESATESGKPKESVDTNQPNIIYEAVESLSPVRNTVDPLELPQKIERSVNAEVGNNTVRE